MAQTRLFNEELREFKSKLRKAYALKSLQAQINERIANSVSDETRRRFLDKMMMKEIEEDIRETEQREKERDLRRREEYRDELKQQIQVKERMKKELEKEERREREVLREVDKVRDEAEVVKRESSRLASAERMMRGLQIQMEIKGILQDFEEESERKGQKKNEEYQHLLEERKVKEEECREEQIRRREESMSRVARMIASLESGKEERETLIARLAEEEIKCQEVMRMREEYLREERIREDLKARWKEQILFNEECKKHFVEQDRIFAETVLQRILNDERLEKLTQQARRRRLIEYQENLKQLMEDKRVAREKMLAEIERDILRERWHEDMIRERLRDTKITLLNIHGDNISEFIDKREDGSGFIDENVSSGLKAVFHCQ